MSERIYAKSRDSQFLIEAEAVRIGPDVLIYLWGGERPHIGSVAAAQAGPSLKDSAQISATASVITFPGHKEDVVVKEASEFLAAKLDVNVVVTAGMHWDDLSAEGIAVVVSNCRDVVRELLLKLQRVER